MCATVVTPNKPRARIKEFVDVRMMRLEHSVVPQSIGLAPSCYEQSASEY
jgi:hypothetical protein